MKPHDVVIGVIAGCVLIVFGLVPGLFHGLVQGLTEGIRNFHDSVFFQLPMSSTRHTEYDKLPRPIWLAGLGAALIVLSVLAYVSN